MTVDNNFCVEFVDNVCYLKDSLKRGVLLHGLVEKMVIQVVIELFSIISIHTFISLMLFYFQCPFASIIYMFSWFFLFRLLLRIVVQVVITLMFLHLINQSMILPFSQAFWSSLYSTFIAFIEICCSGKSLKSRFKQAFQHICESC